MTQEPQAMEIQPWLSDWVPQTEAVPETMVLVEILQIKEVERKECGEVVERNFEF